MLEKAITSVVNQDLADWELIIVDDGTDEDKKLASIHYADPRVQYFWQANAGKGASRNLGLSKARAPYVCFLDDDDEYLSNHLAVFQKAIDSNPAVNIFKTGAIAYEGQQKVFESTFLPSNSEKEQVAFLLKNYFGLLDLCISSTLLNDHRFENYALWQDKFFLLPLLQGNAISQINDRTVRINEHQQRSVNLAYKNTTVISDQLDAIQHAFEKFDLLNKYNFPKSLKDKILNNILATHFYHAKKYEGPIAAWRLARKLYNLHPSAKLIGHFLKYQLSA